MKGKKMNRNKGITLIVLVITIIVLLILAGVTIATLTGDNGILNKTNKASEETDKQTATEIINLKITEAQIKSYAEAQQMPSLQFLADSLCEDEEIEYVELTTKKTASVEEAKVKPITVGQAKSIFTKLKQYPYEFEINGALKLASINGIQVADKDIDNSNNEELKTEIDNLKTEIAGLKEGIENLKNSTIMNQRVKLMSQPVSIALPITGWEEGDFANIQLLDSIKSYKYLEIQFDYTHDYTSGETNEQTTFIATEQLKYHNSNEWSNTTENTFLLNQTVSSHAIGVLGWFKNEKLLRIGAIWNSHNNFKAIRIRNIYGIK